MDPSSIVRDLLGRLALLAVGLVIVVAATFALFLLVR